jgi:hypothetical protein
LDSVASRKARQTLIQAKHQNLREEGSTILKPLYSYTGTEQLSKWMADDVNQVSPSWNGRLQTSKGRKTE